MITFFDESHNKVLALNTTEHIGKGASSDVFATDTTIEGMETVIKRIRVSEHNAADVATEALLQILVVKATEHFHDGGRKGPFAPWFFRIGVDAEYYYLISERMRATIKQMVEVIEKPSHLMYLFVEVAQTMKILWDLVEFNHRDLKMDNIMLDENNRIRFVDFGCSCLQYGSLQVASTYSYVRKTLEHCDVRSRDMKSFFYSFLHNSKFAMRICPLRRILQALMYSGKDEPKHWLSTYSAYNAEPNLPNMFPETIAHLFRHIQFADPENICSEIDPSWVTYIGEWNKGLLKMLTKEELQHLPTAQLLEYMKTYPSARLFAKLMRTTDNEEIRRFCEKAMEDSDLQLNTPTRKGGRRTRRHRRSTF
jgi:serine/threonine protein kinase